MLRNHESREYGEIVIVLLKRFMSDNSPVSPKADGRIVLVGHKELK